MTIDGAIAVVRFGLGGSAGEIEDASRDPHTWLLRQISPKAAMMPAGNEAISPPLTSNAAIALLTQARPGRGTDQQTARNARDEVRKTLRAQLFQDAAALHRHAQQTHTPFAERWVNFWANHFTVSVGQLNTLALVGPFWHEVIRPHVFGDFKRLLTAATLHPAMLSYLDNHRSVGPGSPIGKRRGRDINENLAREVLELHTLGVGGGYTQRDVEAFAKALTGWLPGFSPATRNGNGAPVQFITAVHEPGPKTLLGKRYSQDGPAQAQAMLADLAQHRATAQHIAFKLARHFIADDPPDAAITELRDSFERNGGNLAAVARTLIALEAAWSPRLVKAKTPYELIISASRALGTDAVFHQARQAYQALGQPFARAPSPAGWPDVEDAWLSPDAVKKRLEWSNRVAQSGRLSGDAFLATALGDLANDALRLTVGRAETQAQAITLALMSPAFQRR